MTGLASIVITVKSLVSFSSVGADSWGSRDRVVDRAVASAGFLRPLDVRRSPDRFGHAARAADVRVGLEWPGNWGSQ